MGILVKIALWEKAKNNEKKEKAVDSNDDGFVLCSLTSENKKQKEKKKAWFVENVKMPTEVGMLCNIVGEISTPSPKIHWLVILALLST